MLKCYTGMVQNGKEVPGMKIKQVDCTFGMDQCATVNYEFNVLGFPVKATQAMCSSSFLGCQICSTIKNPALNILKCNVSSNFQLELPSLVITIHEKWTFLVKVSLVIVSQFAESFTLTQVFFRGMCSLSFLSAVQIRYFFHKIFTSLLLLH